MAGRLAADYVPGDRHSDLAVVWAHGLGSHRGGEKSEALRDACTTRGWAFARFDFRGHGRSPGTMPELRASRLIEDLEEIWSALRDRGHTRLCLVGSSMGGFATAWFTARHPEAVLGCVLLAPAFRFLERRWESLSPAEREEWRRSDRLRVKNQWLETELGYALVEEREAFRADELVKVWTTPALIFHGCNDEVVPADDSLDFLRRCSYPSIELRLFRDGDHRLTSHKNEIAAEAVRFFERLARAGYTSTEAGS